MFFSKYSCTSTKGHRGPLNYRPLSHPKTEKEVKHWIWSRFGDPLVVSEIFIKVTQLLQKLPWNKQTDERETPDVTAEKRFPIIGPLGCWKVLLLLWLAVPSKLLSLMMQEYYIKNKTTTKPGHCCGPRKNTCWLESLLGNRTRLPCPPSLGLLKGRSWTYQPVPGWQTLDSSPKAQIDPSWMPLIPHFPIFSAICTFSYTHAILVFARLDSWSMELIRCMVLVVPTRCLGLSSGNQRGTYLGHVFWFPPPPIHQVCGS